MSLLESKLQSPLYLGQSPPEKQLHSQPRGATLKIDFFGECVMGERTDRFAGTKKPEILLLGVTDNYSVWE